MASEARGEKTLSLGAEEGVIITGEVSKWSIFQSFPVLPSGVFLLFALFFVLLKKVFLLIFTSFSTSEKWVFILCSVLGPQKSARNYAPIETVVMFCWSMRNLGKFLLNLAVRLSIFLLNQILKPFLPKKKLEALSHKLIMHILASMVSTRLGKDALILKFNSLDSTDQRSDSTVQTKTNQDQKNLN